jgi:hypothetical protein
MCLDQRDQQLNILPGPTRSTAEHFAALSACILTGNPRPPEDPAFQRRIIPIHLSQDDIPGAEEEKDFNLILKNDIDRLGTLGDFAANYITHHEWKNDWKTLTTQILSAIYKAADREVPGWVNDFVQESQIQDIIEEQEQVIRGFLMKVVNDSHSRNYMSLTSSTDREHQNNDFQSRLLFCLDKDLISFLKRKRNEPEKILILHDIINNMKAQGINHISNLADLGRMLQCEIKPTKLSGKSVRLVEISIDRFIEFVNPISE